MSHRGAPYRSPLSDEEKLQALVADLRILESYYNEVAARESLLAKALVESRAALDSLRAFPKDGESELLVAIGGGVLIRSSAKPPDKLIVSIGADIAIEKTRDEAVAFLENRLQELERAAAALFSQKNELATRINQSRAALGDLVQKQRQV